MGEMVMRTRSGIEVIDQNRHELLRAAAISLATAAMFALLMIVADGSALSAQDKYTVQVPKGLSFSEFRGYEDWQVVAVSQAGDLIEVIVGNPEMINAYRSGIPGNGKPFPDGAKLAKIHWNAKKSEEAPEPTTVPGTLHDVDVMVRDSKRFPDTGNWGYAQFNYDAKSDTFAPEGTGSDCGYSCHTIVQAKDYVFTAYPKR
jgi:Cytochrome P460